MEKLLVGKVAAILGDYEIAVNLGKNSGVKEKMEFEVHGVKPIIDPDTNINLGDYTYTKMVFRVSQVEDKYCIASTISTDSYLTFELSGPTGPMFGDRPKVHSEIPSELLDTNIEIGDTVVQRVRAST